MTRVKWILTVIFVCCITGVMLFQAPSCYAQEAGGATGTVTGRVTDSSGEVFAGAEVTLQSARGGAPLVTQSNTIGYYHFSFVAPGEYTLTAKKTGFSSIVIPHLEVEVQQTATVNIVMNPGKVVQQVNVSASAAALQTQSSTLSGVVGSRFETAIPLPLRDPTGLINLVAGVTNDNRMGLTASTGNQGGLSYQGRLSFNVNGGGRSTAITMIDGVDVTIDAGDFLSIPVVPTPDFTQEFTVQTNDQSAQFGRGSAVLNIVTKSGTNSLHGTAFEFLQNNALNANNLFANTAGRTIPHLERNQYGFALGGPVIIPHIYNGKNKTFWFVNLERMKQLAGLTVSGRVPTPAEVNGDFSNDYTTSGALAPIYNPYSVTVNPTTGAVTRSQFSGNMIPPSMMQAFAQNVAKYFPSPNNPGILGPGGVNTGISNYVASGSAPLDWNRFDVKIDEEVNPSNRVMFRFSRSYYHASPIDFYQNAANPFGLSSRENVQPGINIASSWTSILSPSLVVDQSINVSRFTDESFIPGFDPTSLGGPFASGAITNFQNSYSGGPTFPTISASGYLPLGPDTGSYLEPFANYGYQFGVIKTSGAHTLNAGFQFEYLMGSTNTNTGQPASLQYGGFTDGPNPLAPAGNTGNGFADLLLGLPNNGSSVVGGFGNYLTSKYVAGYFQDDWRVTPKLTLNLGLRYDFTTADADRHNNFDKFNPFAPNPIGSAIGPNTGGMSLNQYFQSLGTGPLQGVVVFPNSALSQGPGIVPTDYSDIAPRIGIAYSVTQKTVIRAGFARLYSLSANAPGAFGNSGGPYAVLTNVIATTNGYTPIVSPNNYFPGGFITPLGNSEGEYTLVGGSLTAGSTTERVTPYSNQWNFGIQRELPGNMTLGVAYAASSGHRLICPHGGVCSDQIPASLLAKYGSSVENTVPNPFYGIITNLRLPLSTPTVQLGQLLKQWPEFSNYSSEDTGTTQGLQSNHDTFHSSFNALEVQFNKRFSNGLSIIAAFTWSKTLANADDMDAGYLGPAAGYQQLVNFNAEYSMTADDVPKRLVIGHVYELPIGQGKTIGSSWGPGLDRVLGHWELSGITTFQSGYPMGIGVTGHTTGAFGGGNRPDVVGSPTAACVSGASRSAQIAGDSLNPAGFMTPPNFSFGNAARTLPCLKDGIKNFDWSLSKSIPIKESIHAQFRADFFNLFNRPQLGSPNTTFNSSGFGTVSSQANSPRVIQFGLKLYW